MGVHGLWELLAPVGRRVSVETLAGKKLAIDASIWMVQFMKAMRDEKGEMVRNAHLLGFFRRICKLLFLRTKPVFVFDGGTPALKRRTVIARRRQRENAQAKIRKTAEKLLLNHLKAMRLKELAHDLESQRQKNDAKGKKVIKDETGNAGNNLEEMNTMPSSCNREELDELLAASLAAEEDGNFAGNASTSGVGISVDEEEDDEDEEMILPAMSGKVDPAVLAALPPSMQLDLLVQMRERLMAENRQKYQKVKKAPAKFSELQIQAYLKTVAFRREIDQVQKSAAGKGMGGVQTSRIASEANREFIFSSSFSGDKEVLASAGVEGHSEKLPHKPSETSSVLLDSISSTNKSNAETGSVAHNPGGVEDIETYQDERGQVRVSRVRAMGIRMTRDLQRNLDMMKGIEQDRMQSDEIVNTESILQKNEGGISRSLLEKFQHAETSYQGTDGSVVNRNDGITCRNENVMEISFEDDGGEKCLDGDDVLFAHLVEGDSLMSCSVDNSALKKHSFSPDSDFDWEEGVIEERVDGLAPAETSCTVKKGIMSSQAEGSDDDSEVVWEDGDSYDLKCASPSPVETRKTVSKGALAEEADFQEAIRRSLKDLSGHESSDASFEDEKPEEHREMVHKTMGARSGLEEIEKLDPNELQENVIQTEKLSYEVVSEARRPEVETKTSKVNTADLSVQVAISPDITERLVEKSHARYPTSDAEPFHKDKSEGENLLGEMERKESVFPAEEAGVPLIVEQLLDTSKTGSKVFPSFSNFSADGSQNSGTLLGENFHAIPADAQPNISEGAVNGSLLETTEHRETYVEESTNHDTVQKLLKEEDCDNPPDQRGDEEEEPIFKDDIENPIEVTESGLEEEIHNLSQERIELGDQQRKLERNMESVSSEMFAECQELLQMFGLPYVIAPMEAEAQCAYMELTSLVDGVVTDDSDAFLFGARSVYKNIFDDRKYVETYLMKDIENELGLSRDKLTRMALLLGSDYTEGVSGIGIVNAIEVVNAFPEEDGFRKFREWIESPDPAILGKVDAQTGTSSRKRGSKVFDNSIMEGLSALDQAVTQITDCIDETKRIFMDKHRNVSKNWHIPSTFPNEAVISAYASPQVDNSTEPFSWGKPDHFVLRKLCWEKFGWRMQKADELLVPVLKEYNKHETQLRLEAFYTFNERFAKIRSKRIKKAVKGIRGNMTTELMDDFAQETSKSRKRRKASPGKCQDDKSEKGLSGKDDRVAKDESNLEKRATKMQSRKRKHAEPVPSEAKNQESVKPSGGRRNTSQGLNARRHRGNGRDRVAGRGRNKKNHDMAFAGSSDDGSHSDSELEMQVEIMEGTQGVRKSTRIRKAVKYTLDDLETNEPAKEDQHEMNSNNEETVQEESSEGHDIIGDDTTGPGDENQNKVRDTSFMEVSNGDYLDMGGG